LNRWGKITWLCVNPAPINIQPASAPLEHVFRHRRFRQWLPCEDDWLDGGLQGGSPSFPLLGFWRGRGCNIVIKGSPFIPIHLFPFLKSFRISTFSSHNFPLGPQLLVNRLTHVQRLREAGAIKPLEAIANLKTSKPQGNTHEIDGPCARKAQNLTARLYDSEHLPPHRRAGDKRVPCLAHESAATVLVIVPGKPMTQHSSNVRLAAKHIRRIGHHRVHALTRQLPHDLKAVSLIERPARHRNTSRENAAHNGRAKGGPVGTAPPVCFTCA